jgi:hypothetical protein
LRDRAEDDVREPAELGAVGMMGTGARA